MKVRFVGTHDPAFNRHVLIAAGLRARGVEVASTTVSAWGATAQRVQAARRGLANPGLAMRLARAYARLGRALGDLSPDEVLYIGHPGQLDVLALRLRFPRRPLVLDGFISISETLADRGLGSARSRRVAALLDRLAFRLADRVVVDTVAHRRRYTTDLGLSEGRAVVVPVGAADPGELPSPPEGSPLNVLYFGGFIPLHGVPTILAAARLLTATEGVSMTLVGDGQDADAAAKTLAATPLPHVHFHREWLSEAELVRRFVTPAHVALGIFGAGPKAMDVVPAKAHLALACGRALVTAESPAVREELRGRANPNAAPVLTCPPEDPAALAALLRQLAADRDLVGQVACAGRDLYQHAFRPEVIVEPLLPVLAALATAHR